MRVTIVGAGIMGLSTAWALARQGHDVRVFEQGPVPNPRSSSVDQHRLIRHPYGARVGYMRMVVEAYRAWDALWADLGERLYVPTGTLVLDTTHEGWAQQSADTLATIGLLVEWLEPAEVEQRFPTLSAHGVTSAFHLPSGGVLLADRIVGALARHLASRDVRIEDGVAAAEIDPARARAVLAGGRVVEADALIVAAGVWAPRLVPSLRTRVTPSRQLVAYLEPPPALAPPWVASPMVLDIAPRSGFYLVPPVAGTSLKVGDHRFTLAGDPDAPREAGEAETRALLDLCRSRLRLFDLYRVAAARVCFYTVEPRERFLLEASGPTWIVSACSGHAFKFGPLLGQALAEAVAGERDAAALARWAAGDP